MSQGAEPSGCALFLTLIEAYSTYPDSVPGGFLRMTFESNIARLDQIVSQLETDRLDLSVSLKLFEEGIELMRLASDELSEAETRVKELVERADGVLELRDFAG